MNADYSAPHIFAEFFNYQPSWLSLTSIERKSIVSSVEVALEDLPKSGVNILASSTNSRVSYAGPYGFYCAYRVNGAVTLELLQAPISSSERSKDLQEMVVGVPARDPLEMQKSFADAENLSLCSA